MADATAALRLADAVLWDAAPTARATARRQRLERAADAEPRRIVRAGRCRPRARSVRAHHSLPRLPSTADVRALAPTMTRELVAESGPSPFDVSNLSAERAVAFAAVPLDDVKARRGRPSTT